MRFASKAISVLANIAKAIAPVDPQPFHTFRERIRQGRRYYCPVCNRHLWFFDPFPIQFLKWYDQYGYVHSIFCAETFNLFDYSCPRCSAADRDRLYALYLRRVFSQIDSTKKYTFIDFAPAPALSNMIKSYSFLNYRSADLLMNGVDDRVDITDMPLYKDNSIDMFLCSHVLEHVEDDRKAMAELYRILKLGGWGILMVPIVLTLSDVYEDASIESASERWKYFGQGDHLRIYGKQGFLSRLENAGFTVRQFGVDYFGSDVFEKHGINPRSCLYVVQKSLSE